MSDTPRTDAVYFKQGATMYDLANEMKLVEHELNAANSKIELLMSANADVARIAGERDAAEKRIKRLEAVTNDPSALWINWLRGDVTLPVGIGDVRQYQDRIKRLEEELMDSKNKHAVLIADVVLNEDKAEQIKRLRKANFQLREGAEEQKQRIKRLEEALEGTVKCFVDLADSGDAGFWNPDEQSVIIAARAALEAKEAKP